MMEHKNRIATIYVLIAVCALAVFASLCCAGWLAAADPTVLSPASTVLIPRDNSNRPIPVFGNGYTVFFDRRPAKVWSYDRTGLLKLETALSLPDASQLTISDVAAAPDGSIAVAATASTSHQIAGVLFWINAEGNVERITRIWPFFAAQIAIGTGDSLWAAGKLTDGQSLKELPQHDLLRQYDTEGRLMRTALPTSSFTGARPAPGSYCVLSANATTIGFYSRRANEYVELDSTGVEVRRWKTSALPENVSIVRGALTSSGDFYIGGGYNRQASGYHMALFRLDKQSGAFVPVDVRAEGSPTRPLTLLGADGDRLILYGKPTGLIWLEPK
jgi:hypothetical protein